MIGSKKGRLLVIVEYSKIQSGKKKRFLLCQCDCGKQKEVRKDLFKKGDSLSCGCLLSELAKEKARNMGVNNKKHGMTGTRIYKVWSSMKERCSNANSKDFNKYGGRGITFDPKWNNFSCFYDDMGSGYKEGLTLERIDVNGNYNKENCIWATNQQQQTNKTNTVNVTYKGETKRIIDWANDLNVSVNTLKSRKRAGWSEEEIIEGRKKV